VVVVVVVVVAVEVTEHKICVSFFSNTFVSNIFHSNKNSARYNRKCTYVCT